MNLYMGFIHYLLIYIYVYSGHSCQYHTIRDTYQMIPIVSCVKNFVSYQRIVSAYELYNTVCISYKSYHIVRYIEKCFKMRFFVKICTFI